MSLQLLFGSFEHGAVKDARIGQADLLQPLFQGLLVEFLDADKINRGYRRTLLQNDDNHVVLDFDAYVLEESCREKRLDGLGGLLVGHGFADFDRQIAEYRTSFGALNTFDSNVFYDERLEGEAGRGKKRREQARKYFLFH